jgi:hypothetical protein
MVHLVDTVEVDAADADQYLAVIETLGVPVMTGAGASFVSCSTTAPDLGEPVRIQVVWAFEDHDHWNDIRKNLVLDAHWYEYGDQIAALRTSGTRRFYYPVSFGAPAL